MTAPTLSPGRRQLCPPENYEGTTPGHKVNSTEYMLRSPSSPISDDGIDFDFFENAARITDTGVHSAKIETPRNGEFDGQVQGNATYTVLVGEAQLKLVREPMAGTGGLLWPAGQVLAEYLARRARETPELFRDKMILELGSGTGIVGLGIAMTVPLGAGTLYLTDLEQVLPVLQRNVLLNQQPHGVQVRELCWGEPAAAELRECDIILLADCIYLECLFEPLVSTLREVMQKPGVVAYLCYKKRRRADAKFFKLLRKHFDLRELEAERLRQMKESMSLFIVTKKH